MAASAQSGRKKTTTAAGRGGRKPAGSKNNTNRKSMAAAQQAERAMANEIILICVFALTVLLFLCNFGMIGMVGDSVSSVMFGIFGLTAYAVPILAFVAIAFGISNQGNRIASMKLTAGIVLFILIGMVLELIGGDMVVTETYSLQAFYENSSANKVGGGVVAGSLAWVSHHFLGMVGTVLLILVLAIICTVVITERSFLSGVKSSGRYVYETARTDAISYRERSERRREENLARRQEALARRQEALARRQEKERLREEEAAKREAEKLLRMERKSSVMMETSLKETPARKTREDMHEITLEQPVEERVEVHQVSPLGETALDFDKIRIQTMEAREEDDTAVFEVSHSIPHREEASVSKEQETEIQTAEPVLETASEQIEADFRQEADVFRDMKEVSLPTAPARQERPRATAPRAPRTAAEATVVGEELARQEKQRPAKKEARPYQFPPLSLLHKDPNKAGTDVNELKETALRLQNTLETFGVRVTITDISQGPAVTRYELQPEQGVKVSRILSLSDDIKLNLAATDIRIEAPIPGKAAIGIEVPNKKNTAVRLREVLESKSFQDFPSRIAFGVGKDIAGKVVVSDIAKMPHMLIAGSTGSGKSVCINTLIMSILYKASPSEVKLILVDPKVVELNVYNGIPHLLIPVVTDPRKASAALQWGCAEMSDRYRKFADYNVRDLKGFNQKVTELQERGETDAPETMPQIVIIVDELADLMMVAPGEVEDSICRLAQLARAAGIHLIIATQRPSVDIITGLIKANMPSRVAFAVKSGVDSRTILDMNGAEKLLGKGDMLFYPQGYTKPLRVQGAFVDDDEVADVVDFLKNQSIGNLYSEEVEEKLKTMGSSAAATGGAAEYDDYFVDAGRFIIDKDKASIGNLQRAFKIGFNRAARIMDQLAQVGVVGEEEGTKPRKVLMTMDEFEQLVEEII